MISQPVSSIFPCYPLPSGGRGELQASPFPNVVFPPLPQSALSSSPFHCALQDRFGQTWWTWDMTIPLQFASPHNGQEVFVWSDCLLDLGTDFLVDNIVFVWDAWYLALAPHFHGLYCCEGPWFTSIEEGGRDKGAHHLYFGTKKKYSCHSKLVSTLSVLLLSVLSWRASRAWNLGFGLSTLFRPSTTRFWVPSCLTHVDQTQLGFRYPFVSHNLTTHHQVLDTLVSHNLTKHNKFCVPSCLS